MSAPNLLGLTTITPVTWDLPLTNSASDVIAAVTSGHAVLIFELIAANKTAAAHIVTVYHKKSGTSYEMAYQVSVPANSTFDILEGTRKWLVDGESITALSDASTQIVITGSGVDCS